LNDTIVQKTGSEETPGRNQDAKGEITVARPITVVTVNAVTGELIDTAQVIYNTLCLTGNNGSYVLPYLPVGDNYSFSVAAAGYRPVADVSFTVVEHSTTQSISNRVGKVTHTETPNSTGGANKYCNDLIIIVPLYHVPATLTLTKKIPENPENYLYPSAHGDATFLFRIQKFKDDALVSTWVYEVTNPTSPGTVVEDFALDWGYKYKITELNTARWGVQSVTKGGDNHDGVIINDDKTVTITPSSDDLADGKVSYAVTYTNEKDNQQYLSDTSVVTNRFTLSDQ
jgi:hypothetical protein